MTHLLTSTELHLTAAGVRAAVAAKKLRLAGETHLVNENATGRVLIQTGEATREVVGGLGYWLTNDTSG